MSNDGIHDLWNRIDQLTECMARVQSDVSALKEAMSFLKSAYFLVIATCIGTLFTVLFKSVK